MNMNNEVLRVKIEDIVPNRFQPREHFADDGIDELAASIKEHGIIQPLVLRKLGDKFEIIAGERRYKAATLAGLNEVPAILSDIDDNKSAEIALVENIQRRNLTAIEEARSYKTILDKGYLTQEGLAGKMGISQSAIANKLRLLSLCDEVQEALMTEKISERHARALLVVEDKMEQKKWLDRILNERLTVRQLDLLLKQNNDAEDEENDVPIVSIDPNLNQIKENAVDINPVIPEKKLDNILMPDENITAIDEENKPLPEIEVNSEEINKNRFFNFLEDEGANMNMEESPSIIFNDPLSDVDNTEVNENNSVLLSNNPEDNLEKTIDLSTIVDNVSTAEPIENNPVQNPGPVFDLSGMNINSEPALNEVTNDNFNIDYNNLEVNNLFDDQNVTEEPPVSINPFNENNEESSLNPFVESEPVTIDETLIKEDNTVLPEPTNIENIPPVQINEVVNPVYETNTMEAKKIVIDPMSVIDRLDPNYEENIKQKEENLLSNAITETRNFVRKLESDGFIINMEEIDLPDNYQITININK